MNLGPVRRAPYFCQVVTPLLLVRKRGRGWRRGARPSWRVRPTALPARVRRPVHVVGRHEGPWARIGYVAGTWDDWSTFDGPLITNYRGDPTGYRLGVRDRFRARGSLGIRPASQLPSRPALPAWQRSRIVAARPMELVGTHRLEPRTCWESNLIDGVADGSCGP